MLMLTLGDRGLPTLCSVTCFQENRRKNCRDDKLVYRSLPSAKCG